MHTIIINKPVSEVADGLVLGNGDLSVSCYQKQGKLVFQFGKTTFGIIGWIFPGIRNRRIFRNCGMPLTNMVSPWTVSPARSKEKRNCRIV